MSAHLVRTATFHKATVWGCPGKLPACWPFSRCQIPPLQVHSGHGGALLEQAGAAGPGELVARCLLMTFLPTGLLAAWTAGGMTPELGAAGLQFVCTDLGWTANLLQGRIISLLPAAACLRCVM